MASLMNGLSAAGAGIAAFAGTAGLEEQKAELANQSAILADSLATTRETALQGQAQAATAANVQATIAGTAANTATEQAGATARTQASIAGNTANTVLQGQIAAKAAQVAAETDMAKAAFLSSLPTPAAREVMDYNGSKPGTPEFQQGAKELALIKAGMDPHTFDTPTPVATPSSAPGSSAAIAPPSPSSATTSSLSPASAPIDGAPKANAAASSTPLPPVIAAAVQGASDTSVAAPKPAATGLSYQPIEPGLDHGAPPGGYNERALLGQPEWLVNMVHAMNEGRMEPATPRSLGGVTSLGTPEGRAASLLAVYNPGFDASMFAARKQMRESIASGAIGDGIQAANTVIQHATEFAATAADLNNGRIPMMNWVANTMLSATGSPRPGNLDMAVATLAAEARKVYAASGGGTQSELDSWEKNFPTDGSPAQQAGAMTTLVNLLHGKLTAVASRINSGMQTNLSALDLLNPTARASYDKLASPATGAAPAAAADQNTPMTSQQMYGGSPTAPAGPAIPSWVKPGDQYSPSRGIARGADGATYGAPQ